MRLDLWAELNLIGNVQPSEFDAMSDDEALARLEALKRVIERAQQQKKAESEFAAIEANFEQLCNTKFGHLGG